MLKYDNESNHLKLFTNVSKIVPQKDQMIPKFVNTYVWVSLNRNKKMGTFIRQEVNEKFPEIVPYICFAKINDPQTV